MKRLTFALLALGLATTRTSPAHAISAKYRAQLEREHKTQVQDAEGVSVAHKGKVEKAQDFFDTYVVGKPIDIEADTLLAQGWKPNNGFWVRNGVAVQLEMDGGTVQHAYASAN